MNHPQSPTASEKTTKERGIALITVLALLMITAVLIMAFFSISQNELTASTVYSQGQEAQLLGTTAVNMVIHQIQAATGDVSVAWASQPGMVRTFDANGFRKAFKLYSDEEMVESSITQVRDDEQDIKSWDRADMRNVYVDLNEPVIREDQVFYPIVDPRAYPEGANSQSQSKSSWKPQNWRDGFEQDPEKRHVEGFYFATDEVKRRQNAKIGNHQVGLPMPVKWIYSLEDGTLGTMDSSNRFEPLSVDGKPAGEGKPSSSNPIVSRIAFWADDETAKVNVNTAAGGRPWDVPRAGGRADRNYGLYQTVRNEFQRYPAHPAMTSLMPVLFPNSPRFGERGWSSEPMEMIYAIAPRIVGGRTTSMSGEREIRASQATIDMARPDRNRLYATFDEMIFRAPDQLQGDGSINVDSALPRETNRFPFAKRNDAEAIANHLNRLRFFVTANSRAPETTVFNTPRISMWPSFHGDPETDRAAPGGTGGTWHFSEYDKRIRFCAEVGASESSDSVPSKRARYHIMRERSDSATHDIKNIARNQELYTYLDWLTEQPIPGVGRSFKTKYPSDRYQILTQVFDYIRCTNLFDDNLVDPVTQSVSGYTLYGDNPSDHRAFTNNRLLVQNSTMTDGDDNRKLQPGHGQVAPLRVNPSDPSNDVVVPSDADSLNPNTFTQGFGRYYGTNEVGLLFICCAESTEELGGRKIRKIGLDGGRLQMQSGGDKAFRPFAPNEQFEGDAARYWYGNVCPISDGDNLTPEIDNAANTDALKQKVAQVYVDAGYLPDATWFTTAITPQKKEQWRIVADRRNWNYTLPYDEPLEPGMKVVQAALLFQLHSPSKGWTGIKPDFRMEVELSGSNAFEITNATKGGKLFPHLSTGTTYELKSPDPDSTHHFWGSSTNGGVYSAKAFFTSQNSKGNRRPRATLYTAGDDPDYQDGVGKTNPSKGDLKFPMTEDEVDPKDPTGDDAADFYPFIGGPIQIKKNEPINFSGGDIEIKIFLDEGYNSDSAQESNLVIQEAKIEMDEIDKMPVPNLHPGIAGGFGQNGKPIVEATRQAPEFWVFQRTGAFEGLPGRLAYVLGNDDHGNLAYGRAQLPSIDSTGQPRTAARGKVAHDNYDVDVARSYVLTHGDARLAAVRPMLKTYNDIETDPENIDETDLIEIERTTGFVKHPKYAVDAIYRGEYPDGSGPGSLTLGSRWTDKDGGIINYGSDFSGIGGGNKAMSPYSGPKSTTAYAPDTYRTRFNPYGDWDNGTATQADGAWINKPDEGNSFGIRQQLELNDYEKKYGAAPRRQVPYFSRPNQQEPSRPGLFSPNRITTGPVMFGSLPTGVYGEFSGGKYSSRPWQTLLFREQPNPADLSQMKSGEDYSPTRGEHPGKEKPHDHYLLDLFWMPVVEPWSISEPLSTAGKINVNYEIAPFFHIKRASGLHAVFQSEEMLTIPNDYADSYKAGSGYGKGYNWWQDRGGELRNINLRSWINSSETLKQFDARFANDDHFVSASQIAETYLVPEPLSGLDLKFDTLEEAVNLWNPKLPDGISTVGDNAREKPYGNIYPRLTTKSNTFQVHFRVQMLKQSIMSPTDPGQRRSDTDWETFDDRTDNIVSEYRGSSLIERYVDPNDQRIPDYGKQLKGGGSSSGLKGIDHYYRFRVVTHQRFAP